MTATFLVGDALPRLRVLPPDSVHLCVTSPPYYGKRDYGVPPSVWGGDESCRHRWGEELLDRSKRSPGTQGGSLTGDGRYQAKACRFEIRSNFCVDCGAWRGALGLEPTPDLYVEHLVVVFEEVRRVLRPDGTLFLNLGDTYATGAGQVGDHPGGGEQGARWKGGPPSESSTLQGNGHVGGGPKLKSLAPVPRGDRNERLANGRGDPPAVLRKKTRSDRDGTHAGKNTAIAARGPMAQPNRMPLPGLKPKDLIGIPWMVAFALRRAGWWLRGENIWVKPNPMPESISDRCTTSHEQVFLLAKSARYFYDAVAVAEPANYAPGCGWEEEAKGTRGGKRSAPQERAIDPEQSFRAIRATRNKRTVWTIATAPFPGAHFATFPPKLVEPCILAGTSARGCCVQCAAPWRRVIRKIFEPQDDVSSDRAVRGAEGQKPMDLSNGWEGYPRGSTQNETVGWWPSCHCEGLPRLTPYPKKPRTKDEAELNRWKRACAAVDAHRGLVCDSERGRRTTPAVVLDPFGGACTTAMVADRLQRDSLMIEMNPGYAAMGRQRLEHDGGIFVRAAE